MLVAIKINLKFNKPNQFDYGAVVKLLSTFKSKQMNFHYTTENREAMIAEGIRFISNQYEKSKRNKLHAERYKHNKSYMNSQTPITTHNSFDEILPKVRTSIISRNYCSNSMRDKIEYSDSLNHVNFRAQSLREIHETPYKNTDIKIKDNAIINALETPVVSVTRKKKNQPTSPAIYSESVCLPNKEIKLDSIPEFGNSKMLVCKEIPLHIKKEIQGSKTSENSPTSKYKKINKAKKKDGFWEKSVKDNNESDLNINQKLSDLLDTKIDNNNNNSETSEYTNQIK